MRVSDAITGRVRYTGSDHVRATSPWPILFIHELLFTSESRLSVRRYGGFQTIELIRGS